MTERIVAAIEHPLRGRDRPPDAAARSSAERRTGSTSRAVIEAAARTRTMLEINASPDRRDMNEVNARAAAAAGVPIVINCDAHRVGGFAVARYGVATARRAWLTAADVANTRPWEEFATMRPRSRAGS